MSRALSRAVPILLGLLLGGVVCFHQISEADAGWHLATGRLVSTRGVPFENALTWTAPHEPYYATSWLYDWLAATFTTHFGMLGLQIFTFLLVALTIAGVALACARLDRQRGLWMAPLVALMLVPRITERPHVASWVLLAFVLWLCLPPRGALPDFWAKSWPRRLVCVPLIALGSNFHSGAAFPALVLVFFCVEAFLRGGRHWRELAIAVVGLAALMANPGGVHNLQYLLENIHVQSVIKIIEMEPPKPESSPVFFIALPIGLYAAWRERRRTWALLGATILFALLALRAVRFAHDFEIVAAIAVVQALAPVRGRWPLVVPIAAAAILCCFRIPDYRALHFGPAFDERQLPVRAAAFIHQEGIFGRMFNGFRDGGYLEWAVPEQRWFQDARVQAFPASFFQREQEAESSASDWREWLKSMDVEWAVASRWPEHLAGYTLFESPEWALVYWDETSEVRLRRDVARFAPIIAELEYRHFRPNAPVDVGTASPAELVQWDHELQRFEETSPRFATAFVIHCAVRSRLGSDPASICDRAEALADTPQLRKSLAQVRGLGTPHR